MLLSLWPFQTLKTIIDIDQLKLKVYLNFIKGSLLCLTPQISQRKSSRSLIEQTYIIEEEVLEYVNISLKFKDRTKYLQFIGMTIISIINMRRLYKFKIILQLVILYNFLFNSLKIKINIQKHRFHLMLMIQIFMNYAYQKRRRALQMKTFQVLFLIYFSLR